MLCHLFAPKRSWLSCARADREPVPVAAAGQLAPHQLQRGAGRVHGRGFPGGRGAQPQRQQPGALARAPRGAPAALHPARDRLTGCVTVRACCPSLFLTMQVWGAVIQLLWCKSCRLPHMFCACFCGFHCQDVPNTFKTPCWIAFNVQRGCCPPLPCINMCCRRCQTGALSVGDASEAGQGLSRAARCSRWSFDATMLPQYAAHARPGILKRCSVDGGAPASPLPCALCHALVTLSAVPRHVFAAVVAPTVLPTLVPACVRWASHKGAQGSCRWQGSIVLGSELLLLLVAALPHQQGVRCCTGMHLVSCRCTWALCTRSTADSGPATLLQATRPASGGRATRA